MDAITSIAMSIDIPILETIAMAIHNDIFYALLVIAIAFMGEQRKDKRLKIAFSLLLTFLLVFGLKELLAVERPCMDFESCPEDYSFPSMHAAIAFTLMTAFMNKRSYALYLLFALFVSFTRLNLGVHTFYDIAAALPVALLSYYLATVVYEGDSK